MRLSAKEFFSVRDVFKTRNLAVMAMLLAVRMVLSQFSITLTPTFKLITFDYLPGVIVSMLYGPVAGIVFGLAGDTLGFFVKPLGPYFFGYALSEMVANLLYAAFLYRRPVTLARVALARGVVTVIVIFGLNFVWNVIMYGSAASVYFTSARLINNLVQFPVHTALIVFLGKLAQKVSKLSFEAA